MAATYGNSNQDSSSSDQTGNHGASSRQSRQGGNESGQSGLGIQQAGESGQGGQQSGSVADSDRIRAAAEGPEAVANLLGFADALSARTAG